MSIASSSHAPEDITLPGSGSTTARELLSAYLRLQYRALATVPFGRLIGSEAGDAFTENVRALAKSEPGLLFSVLRKPTIGGLLRLIVTRDGSAAEMSAWAKEIMAQVNFELAMSGKASGKVPAAGAYQQLVSLQRGIALPVPFSCGNVVFDGASVRIEGPEGGTFDFSTGEPEEVRRPYHPIRGPVVLAEYDNNPRAGIEAHPDKAGNHVDLGSKQASEWVDSLREAFDIVAEFAPTLMPEIELLIHQMVPVGYEPEKHLSASLMEVIGNIYLSLHPDPLVMAEAIVHEFSHNKINVLWTLNPLLENAFEPLYASPVRPDPRPLFGVLLAVHAFLPVESMYRALAESGHEAAQHPRFAERLRQVRAANDEAATTVLTNGKATDAGGPVLEEIRRLNAEFAATA